MDRKTVRVENASSGPSERVPQFRQFSIVDPYNPMQKASVTSDGKLKVDAVLEAEHITIGNVKIQDASTSNLAAVDSDGQLAVQNPPNLDAKASDIKSDLDTISGQLDAKTSTLAKESGGNLAALAGKDFATQTTLAAIKAKTDNLDAASSTLAKESGGNLDC
jgi:hypothetical protein